MDCGCNSKSNNRLWIAYVAKHPGMAGSAAAWKGVNDMPTKKDIEAHARFWTIEEIAEYIINNVNRRKPLDTEIIEEWNYFMGIKAEVDEGGYHDNV